MTYLLAEVWLFIFGLVLMIIFVIAEFVYFNRGRHRGEYVEHKLWDKNTILINYPIVVPDYADPEITAYFTLQPRGGLFDIPCLAQEDDGGIGRFGDLTIDRADSEPLWPFLPDGTFDDRLITEQGWQWIGALHE